MEPRCQEVQPLLMQLAGGELPPADGPKVADHLAECARCRKEWDVLRAWLEALVAMPRVTPPTEERRKIRERALAIRDARVTRRAWRGLGVAAAALLAAIGMWVTSRTSPPGDSAGVQWHSPALASSDDSHWTNGIDSGLADVWFSLRDLREGKGAIQPMTPPESIATSAAPEYDLEEGARVLRWEWDRGDDEGGFDFRLRDLEQSIDDLSDEDRG